MYGNMQASVPAAAMTDAVWDAVFLGTELAAAEEFPRWGGAC
jgi:hypothetical protein